MRSRPTLSEEGAGDIGWEGRRATRRSGDDKSSAVDRLAQLLLGGLDGLCIGWNQFTSFLLIAPYPSNVAARPSLVADELRSMASASPDPCRIRSCWRGCWSMAMAEVAGANALPGILRGADTRRAKTSLMRLTKRRHRTSVVGCTPTHLLFGLITGIGSEVPGVEGAECIHKLLLLLHGMRNGQPVGASSGREVDLWRQWCIRRVLVGWLKKQSPRLAARSQVAVRHNKVSGNASTHKTATRWLVAQLCIWCCSKRLSHEPLNRDRTAHACWRNGADTRHVHNRHSRTRRGVVRITTHLGISYAEIALRS